ncbi:class I SAM-dependent methyltransferase [Hymenobacter sp.]|jgi:SAM-dependent methyltransferase|uniref:class I SAM-dependent methyltransferase n=1 Tax=Hymenobacter sp. TaxID=1898978 RepID=UPI002ED95AC8
MSAPKSYLEIARHYEACLRQHGDTHLGVDWPNEKDAYLRYQVMLEVIRGTLDTPVSLLDFGCGTSHLYEYMQRGSWRQVEYIGLDISPEYVKLAQAKYPDIAYYCVDILAYDEAMPEVDYVVMNGVFTEKRGLSFAEMWEYFQRMLTSVFRRVRRGMAFNVMSKQVDWERDDLFHLSTDLLFAFLKENLSRHWVLRHEYGLYEYTVYVYKTSHAAVLQYNVPYTG